jgi:hypothetical protein
VVLRHCGKPVRFPVRSKGEWLAILWLKVVCTTPLKRPNWFVRDCLPTAQFKIEKYSPDGDGDLLGFLLTLLAGDFPALW